MIKLILLFLFFMAGCSFDNEKPDKSLKENRKTETTNGPELIQVFELDSLGNTLELLKDDKKDYILLQTKQNARIVNIAGSGYSEFALNENKNVELKKLKFPKENNCYLVEGYIYGSTYGAVCYFIVYGHIGWLITPLPFDRVDVYDIDNDGYDEIIEYRRQGKQILYTFERGLILPDKAGK